MANFITNFKLISALLFKDHQQTLTRPVVTWDIISQLDYLTFPITILRMVRTQNDQEYLKAGPHSPIILVCQHTLIISINSNSSRNSLITLTIIIWMPISFSKAWALERHPYHSLLRWVCLTTTTRWTRHQRRQRTSITGITSQTV